MRVKSWGGNGRWGRYYKLYTPSCDTEVPPHGYAMFYVFKRISACKSTQNLMYM